jgi:ribonuclease Z
LWRDVDFPITWRALRPGDTHPIDATRTLEAFAVTHQPAEPAFGYRVLEGRRRVKAEFAAAPQSDLARLARAGGREQFMEAYTHVLFAHSGDAMPIDVNLIRDAELLVHDATFLEPTDRREPIHASSREVFELARAANVRSLILVHLSIRYERPSAIATLRAQLAASGFLGACWLLDESSFVNLR